MNELRGTLLCHYDRTQIDATSATTMRLQRAVVGCWKLRQQGRYHDLGTTLTKLLGALDAAVRAGGSEAIRASPLGSRLQRRVGGVQEAR